MDVGSGGSRQRQRRVRADAVQQLSTRTAGVEAAAFTRVSMGELYPAWVGGLFPGVLAPRPGPAAHAARRPLLGRFR